MLRHSDAKQPTPSVSYTSWKGAASGARRLGLEFRQNLTIEVRTSPAFRELPPAPRRIPWLPVRRLSPGLTARFHADSALHVVVG